MNFKFNYDDGNLNDIIIDIPDDVDPKEVADNFREIINSKESRLFISKYIPKKYGYTNIYGNESQDELSYELKKIKHNEDKEESNTNNFEENGRKIGKLVNDKQKAYGDSITKTKELLKIFLKDYKNEDGTYTIPESLLDHIGLQVRILDKQNRIFSNPDGDMMEENSFNDIVGYGLLGSELLNNEQDS